MRRVGMIVAVVIAYVGLAAGDARAANPIEKAIEQAKPCARVKVSRFGMTIGLDEFKSADIQTLHLDIADDAAKMSMKGSLSCKSSGASLVKADASAEIDARLALDLRTCEFSENSIHIVSAGGALGAAIEAAKPEIERALERGLVGMARSLCK